MKILLILCVAICVLESAIADGVDLSTTACTPGTTRQNDCNTCVCGQNGTGYRCTKLACPKPVVRKRRSENVTPDLALTPCTPGTTTQYRCNTCTCVADGSGYTCTRAICPEPAVHDRRRRSTSIADLATQTCTPGTQLQHECNTCRCGERGDGYQCTRRLCPPTEQRVERSADISTQTCTPGTKIKQDCNTCTCGPRGDGYSCTRIGCYPKRQERDLERQQQPAANDERGRCVPGTSFKKECNTCFCNENGLAMCTLRGCSSHRTTRDVDGVNAVGENTTVGTHSIGQVGTNSDATSQAACIPGTTFKRDCNTCVCTENGVAACTLIFCLSGRKKRDVETRAGNRQPACVPGTTFKRDCNTCRCGQNGVAACTEKACLNTGNNRPSCTPGTTFKKGCNTCRCGQNGIAACTEKLCLNGRKKRETVEDCIPGKSFKKECNTCRCSSDGRSAACTQKFCIHRDKRGNTKTV